MKNKTAQLFSLTIKRIFPALLCLCLSFSACTSQIAQPAQETDTLFSYAIDTRAGIITPRNVKFNMAMSEVLQATGLSEDDIAGEADDPVIMHSIAIDGLSDNIREIFVFQDDKLVTIRYAVTVSEEDYEKTCQTLEDQASTEMHTGWLVGKINSLAENSQTLWEDTEKNYVSLSPAISSTPGERVILLEVHMTHGDQKTLID